jgi:hypothetical protein
MQAAQGQTGASVFGSDPWGIPSIYPAAIISIGLLVIVSLMTPPPTEAELAPIFGEPAAKA